jgi:hypothetical protein
MQFGEMDLELYVSINVWMRRKNEACEVVSQNLGSSLAVCISPPFA